MAAQDKVSTARSIDAAAAVCAALLQVGAAQRYGLNGRGTRVCVLDNNIGEQLGALLQLPLMHKN
jgi:hypothetical protein